MGNNSFTSFKTDLREHVGGGAYMGSWEVLEAAPQKLAMRVIRSDSNVVRALVSEALRSIWDNLEKQREHIAARIASLAIKFRRMDELIMVANHEFTRGAFESAISILGKANNHANEDIRPQLEQQAEAFGRSSVEQQAMLHAFEFFKIRGLEVLLQEQEEELRTFFADHAMTTWNRELGNCGNGEQFNALRMQRYLEILQAVHRPDLLYTCATKLEKREEDRLKEGRANGGFSDGTGWSRHIMDTFGRANDGSVLFGDLHSLNEEQITHIGAVYERYHEWDRAAGAYHRAGAWREMETLGLNLLRMNAGELERAISLLEQRANLCADPLAQETQVAIMATLSRLTSASLPGKSRRKGAAKDLVDAKTGHKERLENLLKRN